MLSNKRFLALAALCSAQFVAASQLYLMLPEQLSRTTASQDLLGWFYVGAAMLVIAGQRPMVALAARIGHRTAVIVGIAVMAVSFALPAVTVATAPGGDPTRTIVSLAAWVAVLHLGQMVMVPPMRDTLARIAGEKYLGGYFGLLNTIGGCLALAATLGVGYLFDLVDEGGVAAATPWSVVACCIVAPAAVLYGWSRRSNAIWPQQPH